jgi:hypothetical protein
MKKKTWQWFLALIAAVAMIAGIVLPMAPVAAQEAYGFPRNTLVPDGPAVIDGTYMLGPADQSVRHLAAKVGPAAATQARPLGDPAEIGTGITVTVSDFYLGEDYDETFVVVGTGEHGIILVTAEAYGSFDGTYYHFVNPNGDDSEPWLRTEDLISTEQLDYLLEQFDTVIYPTDTGIFGEPLPRGDEGQKVWILIHNIRDDAYYDPEAGSYIAGYFSASEDATNNKNMMHIDSYDWLNRTGPDSARPFLYEGVFAHEFEHLIHFDQDPDEESWVDEGLADMAGFLCGYGHSSDHIAYYLVYHPMVSLTFWGGGLENYGASYLFQLYLYEHYGGLNFTRALVQEQANGIEGVENALSLLGYRDSFDTIFDNWTMANYLDNTSGFQGKYGYRTLEMGSEDSRGYTIEYVLENFWWGPPAGTPLDVPSDWLGMEPQPYTVHYIPFYNDKLAMAGFDGGDFSGTPAYSGSYEWYSGAGAWAWQSFGQTFTIPDDGATLNFKTYFEIEEDWDYGYVEVYDQNTGEWWTLDAEGTVDYVAFAQDNPNVPAGREPSDYEAAGRWHAFTGYSGGWQAVTMDLTPFAGHTIDLYFRTWQDGAFTLQMMYVDDISITELGFFDDVESGEDGWAANGWYITDGMLDNNFSVNIMAINANSLYRSEFPEPAVASPVKLTSVTTMGIDRDAETGSIRVPAAPASSYRIQVAIITNHADHILPCNYDFWVYPAQVKSK